MYTIHFESCNQNARLECAEIEKPYQKKVICRVHTTGVVSVFYYDEGVVDGNIDLTSLNDSNYQLPYQSWRRS